MTLNAASTTRAVRCAAVITTPTTHAHAYAAKFWATKNFAAYGLRGTWSSTR